MTEALTYCLVGCGSAFDCIATEPQAYAAGSWEIRHAAGVAQLASTVSTLLAGLSPQGTRLFIAVDAQALNYARLELYGVARLTGLKMATLVHPTAWIAPGVKLGDNVWVGPGARIGPGCRIDSDVLLNVGVRLDEKVHVSAHGWVGPGSSLGVGVRVGLHSVIGADVQVRAGVQIGRHCTIDHGGVWTRDLVDGSFLEPEMPSSTAQIIGAGYSFQRKS